MSCGVWVAIRNAAGHTALDLLDAEAASDKKYDRQVRLILQQPPGR
jgi:hypothetical protein